MNINFDRRQFVRNSILLNVRYEHKGIINPCRVIDITEKGLTIRTKGSVKDGDSLKILLKNHIVRVLIIKMEGNTAEAIFDNLPESELIFIMDLIISKTWETV
jgi:hypothetical protein